MRQSTALVIAVIFCTSWVNAQTPLRIGLVTDGGADSWKTLTDELQNKVDSAGAVLEVSSPSSVTLEEQQQNIEHMIGAGVSVLAVCPLDGMKQREFFKKISNTIPLVLLRNDIPDSGRKCVICQDFGQTGRMMGSLLTRLVPGGMKVVALTKTSDTPSVKAWLDGIREGVSSTEIILDVVKEDKGDASVAWANADALMGKRPELAAYLACEEYQLPALLKSARDHKMARLVNLVGPGNTPEIRAAFDKGEIMGLLTPDVAKEAEVLAAILLGLAKKDASFTLPENGIFKITPILEQTKAKISPEEMLDALQVPRVLQETSAVPRPSFE